MFIPTSYTGKGKPFAFLPETMSPGPWSNRILEPPLPPRDPSTMFISAYWQEVKAGTLLMCFGTLICQLDKQFFPNGIDDPSFTFDTFLEFADSRVLLPNDPKPRHVLRLQMVNAVHKLGRPKPWKAPLIDHSPYFDEEAAYDPQILNNMLVNPSQVPVGAIGWFKLAADK